MDSRKINTDSGVILAYSIKLMDKTLVLLKGSRGYIMCGYLNMKVAEKFKDVAVKITGVSTIDQALQTAVHSCSSQAKKLGIFKGQKITEVLKLIA